MPPDAKASPEAVSREELVKMIARSHGSANVPYAESALTGRTLAAQSKLPRAIAENLGAGFGQWSFFPEPSQIVDFALSYVPPATEDDLWAMAREWASDDAAGRPTMLSLVGREILQQESRRIDAPKLRALLDESRHARALALRQELGLEVPRCADTRRGVPPVRANGAELTKPASPAVAKASAKLSKAPPIAQKAKDLALPAPPPKRFRHPKFGEGLLERQEGQGSEAKLTIAFAAGPKTVLARFVTETVPSK